MVAAVDCTGHGVPGAFMSMIGNILLNEIVINEGIITPSKVLTELNLRIIKSLKQDSESLQIYTQEDVKFGPYFKAFDNNDLKSFAQVLTIPQYHEVKKSVIGHRIGSLFLVSPYIKDEMNSFIYPTNCGKVDTGRHNLICPFYSNGNKYEVSVYTNSKYFRYFSIKKDKNKVIIEGSLIFNKGLSMNRNNFGKEEFYQKYYICEIPFKVKDTKPGYHKFMIKNNKLYCNMQEWGSRIFSYNPTSQIFSHQIQSTYDISRFGDDSKYPEYYFTMNDYPISSHLPDSYKQNRLYYEFEI